MKKKILFVARSVVNFYGAEKSMLKIMEVLKNDYCVEFLSSQDNTEFVDAVRKMGVKVHIQNFVPQKRRVLYTAKNFYSTLKYLKKEVSPDYIYLNREDTLIAFGVVAIFYRLFKSNVKIINQLRENIYLKKKHFLIMAFIDKVIVNSEYMKTNLIPQRFHKKSFVIYPLIDSCECSSEKRDRNFGVLKIIYVGKISRWKGQLRFMQVITSAVQNSVLKGSLKIDMYGEAVNGENINYEKELMAHIKLHKMEHIAVLKGYNANICKEYSKYTLKMFLTSQEEGTPRVLIESASAGTPYIATDLPQIREFTSGGLGGLLVDKNSDSDIIDAINKFTDKEFYEAKVAECKKLTVLRINEKKFVGAYEEIFS